MRAFDLLEVLADTHSCSAVVTTFASSTDMDGICTQEDLTWLNHDAVDPSTFVSLLRPLSKPVCLPMHAARAPCMLLARHVRVDF